MYRQVLMYCPQACSKPAPRLPQACTPPGSLSPTLYSGLSIREALHGPVYLAFLILGRFHSPQPTCRRAGPRAGLSAR